MYINILNFDFFQFYLAIVRMCLTWVSIALQKTIIETNLEKKGLFCFAEIVPRNQYRNWDRDIEWTHKTDA